MPTNEFKHCDPAAPQTGAAVNAAVGVNGPCDVHPEVSAAREVPIVHQEVFLTEEGAEILDGILENPNSPVGRPVPSRRG